MFELVVAVFLILLNGVFSLSELAVVSARKSRLKLLAEQRRPGAVAALALAEEPGRFLSTVQIGITLIGILAGAFSGAALGQRFASTLAGAGLPNAWAEPLGYGLVIGVITYLSVVIGELVPKNLALRHAEAIACAVAAPMQVVSRAGAPVVWVLDASTRMIFRLFGPAGQADSTMTDEEIRSVMAEAETAGVIETDEHRMISGVLRLGDRAVRGVMTPRTEVEWLDLRQPEDELRRRLSASTHARLPVGEGNGDAFLGVVQLRDIVPDLLNGSAASLGERLRSRIRPVAIVPDTSDALDALSTLREAEVPIALVHDEYGHFEGVVTPADILDAIAGAFRADEGADEEEAVQRSDGSWLVSGAMPVDEMAERLGLALPLNRDYDTAAGLILAQLRRLPNTGDVVSADGWTFEIVDMDGRRIDKILAAHAA